MDIQNRCRAEYMRISQCHIFAVIKQDSEIVRERARGSVVCIGAIVTSKHAVVLPKRTINANAETIARYCGRARKLVVWKYAGGNVHIWLRIILSDDDRRRGVDSISWNNVVR